MDNRVITLTLADYKLDNAKRDLLLKLMFDYPLKGNDWYAKELGVSVTTLISIAKKHKIKLPRKLRDFAREDEAKAIKILEAKGYTITKK